MKPHAPENNSLFKFLVALISLAGIVLFITGIVANGALFGLGLVLIFTSFVGWASMKGIDTGSTFRINPTDQASIHHHRSLEIRDLTEQRASA